MTRTLRNARIAASAVLAALGAAACVGGLGYGLENEDGAVGTGLLPAASGALIAVLALVDLAQQLLAARRAPASADADINAANGSGVALLIADGETGGPTDGIDVLGRTPRQRNRNLVVVLALVFAAALLVPFSGLLIAMGLLILAITIGVERMRPLSAVAVTAVALACVWLVFAQGLRVPFPTGMLGLI
ncbi:tripartite tricarboxylate transporter TctB family protein [Glycomyces sp. YM15]|uniref:tripartite tricarboxylate transporter TctB family protein n=1 Tax=Glycomyces sp. YM15 TaxID=2800446 RepID=UPI0019629A82|nr:tripartite tricarboxylate transporter TctB family protein [Glycomyces sp. YM15]